MNKLVKEQREALPLLAVAGAFREAGIRTELSLSGKSIGNQIAQIARSADFALIIGRRERELQQVTVKNLRTGGQKVLSLADTIGEVSGSEPR